VVVIHSEVRQKLPEGSSLRKNNRMVNCLLAGQKDMHDTQKVQWVEIVMRKMRKEYVVATTFHSC